jgi:hypothetical protein
MLAVRAMRSFEHQVGWRLIRCFGWRMPEKLACLTCPVMLQAMRQAQDDHIQETADQQAEYAGEWNQERRIFKPH